MFQSFRADVSIFALFYHDNANLQENAGRTATGLMLVLSGYDGRVNKQ